jgi:hypothetical protein
MQHVYNCNVKELPVHITYKIPEPHQSFAMFQPGSPFVCPSVKDTCSVQTHATIFIHPHLSLTHTTKTRTTQTVKPVIAIDTMSLQLFGHKRHVKKYIKDIIAVNVVMRYIGGKHETKNKDKDPTLHLHPILVTAMLCNAKKHITNDETSITKCHINSGYTEFSVPSNSDGQNVPNKIIIYREEEWIKVLIHELVHFKKIEAQPFTVIRESYVETLATILNIVRLMAKSKADITSLSFDTFVTILHKEIILEHRHISRACAYIGTKRMNDTTNVKWYYIGKLINLKHILDGNWKWIHHVLQPSHPSGFIFHMNPTVCLEYDQHIIQRVEQIQKTELSHNSLPAQYNNRRKQVRSLRMTYRRPNE